MYVFDSVLSIESEHHSKCTSLLNQFSVSTIPPTLGQVVVDFDAVDALNCIDGSTNNEFLSRTLLIKNINCRTF